MEDKDKSQSGSSCLPPPLKFLAKYCFHFFDVKMARNSEKNESQINRWVLKNTTEKSMITLDGYYSLIKSKKFYLLTNVDFAFRSKRKTTTIGKVL